MQHRFSVPRNGLLRTEVEIECVRKIPLGRNYVLIDTGAAMCHMSFSLWKNFGFDEILQKHIDDSPFGAMFKDKIENLPFEDLLLQSAYSEVGDGRKVQAYTFKLDSLKMGAINFEDVVVKLINTGEPTAKGKPTKHGRMEFIVGWNILKYLSVQHRIKQGGDIGCVFTLDPEHYKFYQDDTYLGKKPHEHPRFNLIMDEVIV
ncbi:MAG: retroviral-like aspartic protease family protein [Defluviitaleaceae bacterium]|nr:retroviral-like aspartic protease family protein [Defluviitaleaceae bacterium]